VWRTHSCLPCRDSSRHLLTGRQASTKVSTRHAGVRALQAAVQVENDSQQLSKERTASAVLASVIDPELLQGGSPAHLQASPWRLLHRRSLHTGTKIESDPMTLTVGSIYRRPHTNQTGTLHCDHSRRRQATEVRSQNPVALRFFILTSDSCLLTSPSSSPLQHLGDLLLLDRPLFDDFPIRLRHIHRGRARADR